MSKMIQLQISLFQLEEPDSSIQATLEQGSWIGKNNVVQDGCHIEGCKWVGMGLGKKFPGGAMLGQKL